MATASIPSLSVANERGNAVPRERARERENDWAWLVAVTVALLALCGLPYVVSALFGPPDLERLGTFWFSRDFSQYQAAMREDARQSGWLIHDHFSAEPHTPALMYPLYVAAGKLAASLGVSDLSMFAVLEWLGRLSLIGALYVFAASLVRGVGHGKSPGAVAASGERVCVGGAPLSVDRVGTDDVGRAEGILAARRQVRLAVLLSLGTLGLDALLAPVRMILDNAGVHALDAVLPDAINPYLEVSSFGALLSAPHLMFGLALTLVAAPLYLRAIQPSAQGLAAQVHTAAIDGPTPGRLAWLALLGADVFVLSLVHSFNTPVLVSVFALHALLVGRRAWPAAIVAGLVAAPMGIYSLLLYQADPFWSGTYSAQNLMPSPPPWSLPADFGLVLLAAPLAWPVVRRWPSERRWLILLWIGLGLAWMYAPVAYQRRFAFGVQPGLAVLAAVGLLRLQALPAGQLRRRLTTYTVLVAGVSTSLLVYVALLASAVVNKPAPVYLWSRAEADAGAWLGDHTTADDLILASTPFANPLVGTIDGRVVHGHIVATLHSPEKEALVQRFYASETTPTERARILAETEATVVALGPRERALGGAGLAAQPGLDLIYDRDGVELFRVQHA